jgi:hypothetical protein
MNLTPDAKYSIATKLSGKELTSFCSTDSEMRRLCSSSKFSPIWQKHIKNDFNIDYIGKHGYMEYLQYTYIFNQKLWVVTVLDTDQKSIMKAEIFKNFNEAVIGISNEIEKEKEMTKINMGYLSYPSIKAHFENHNSIKYRSYIYEITEGNFQHTSDEKEKEYEKQLNILADIAYGNNLNKDEEYLKNDIKNDFKTAVENSLDEDEEKFSFDSFWGIFSISNKKNKNLSKIKMYAEEMLKN